MEDPTLIPTPDINHSLNPEEVWGCQENVEVTKEAGMIFEGLEQCILTASMTVFFYFNNCAYKLNVGPLPSYSPKMESLLTAFWVSFQRYSITFKIFLHKQGHT